MAYVTKGVSMNITQEQEKEIVEEVTDGSGVYVIPNFLDQHLIEEFIEETERTFSTMEDGDVLNPPHPIEQNGYWTGKSLRVHPNEYMQYIPKIVTYFRNNEFFSNVLEQYYGGPCDKFQQFVFSREYKLASDFPQYVRSGNMHVDMYQALKFNFYLTDCTKGSGAFRYHPGTHKLGEEYRRKGGIFIHDNKELWDKYNDENCTYAEGPAGSLLILDTSVLHAGGLILEEGLERRTIMIHNRR